MLIDIGAILRGETDIIEIDHIIDPPEDFDDIHFTGKVSVKGRVRNMAGYMTLEVRAILPFTTHCSRCWKEISREFTLDFSKRIAAKNTLQNEDNDDYIIIEKNNIDMDSPLLEAILLDFPMTFLCKEDCRGLCPKCGADLNSGDCSCVKKEIDPRLEILKKLLDK